MSKKVFTIAASLMIAASALAIPAKRTIRQVVQPDGTTLSVGFRGDENFHFAATADGTPVMRRADGAYCYATLSADGKTLIASDEIAHDVAQRSASEIKFLKTNAATAAAIKSRGAARAAERNAARTARLSHNTKTTATNAPLKQQIAGAGGEEGSGVTGKRRGLVILVNFQDVKMQEAHSRSEWDDYFNKEGYNKLGNSGSVHDYFYNQSYGQFDLSFDVVGPVTVSKKMSAYGGNDSDGNDVDPAGMVYEACQLAKKANPSLNFADYDWDGDGRVDQVYVIYAGYGEAAYPEMLEDCIWQHEWELSSAGYSLVIDGTRINTYGCSSELNGYTGDDMDGIGTACHEFSHCLGLPDLYDTSGGSNFGMDEWDLMDYGSYAGNGYTPIGYNSYEKWVSGWMQPKEISSPCYAKDMKALSEEPEAYIVRNEKTPTEYYLLENRQLTGSDAAAPAHGMLVIHVDYDAKAWMDNTVNNTSSHQRFTIIPADNILSSKTTYADTYPGTKKVTSLTDTSKPAARLFNANSDGRLYMGKPITDIYEDTNGRISFTFMGGESIDVPDNLTSTVSADGFTASWTAVDNADSYTIELREKKAQGDASEHITIDEDLSGWGEGKKQDGTNDISASLDSKMKNKGWTGTKVYEGIGCAKLGSSKQQGLLNSPVVNIHDSEKVTVRVMAKTYGNDDALLTLSLADTDGNTIASQDIVPDGSTATISLDNAQKKDYRLCLQPKKRGYIYSIALYDGDYTDEDFANETAAPKAAIEMGRMKRATQQFYNIKTNSYNFTALAKAVYQWRVQAVKDDLLSAWTPWQTVDLTAESGIDAATADTAIDPTTEVEVFAADGTAMGKTTYGEFVSSQRRHGVYVLRHKNGVKRITK